MTDEATYVLTEGCAHCNQLFDRILRVGSDLVPSYCSPECKRRAKNKRIRQKQERRAADPALQHEAAVSTYHMSAQEKRVYELLRADKRSEKAAAAYNPEAYRKSGGYKGPKPGAIVKPRTEFDVVCPHPFKKPYRTAEEAQAFIDRTHRGDAYIKPYTCKCGGIHIGHDYPPGHPMRYRKPQV